MSLTFGGDIRWLYIFFLTSQPQQKHQKKKEEKLKWI